MPTSKVTRELARAGLNGALALVDPATCTPRLTFPVRAAFLHEGASTSIGSASRTADCALSQWDPRPHDPAEEVVDLAPTSWPHGWPGVSDISFRPNEGSPGGVAARHESSEEPS